MRILAAVLLAIIAIPATAQVAPKPPIVTDHSGTFNGKRVAYAATIEPFDVNNADGTPSARLVAISYTAKGRPKPDRPVLFIFNGGPIGPSSILHMGAFGPKRVAVPDDIAAPASTFRLIDNPYTLLDVADLVFFDPAGTGFSTFAPGTDPKTQFSNVADAHQLAELVVAWSKAHDRIAAPKYLVGESYGTHRAPEAARQLQTMGTPVQGLVLLGQAVNIIEYAQRRGNIISYVVSLPTLAAVAWEHGRAERKGRDFDAFMKDARAFAETEYLTTLFQGDAATPDRQRAVAARLQEYTGLSADWYLAHALRITKVDYQKILLPGQQLATNDARYAGPVDGPDPFNHVLKAFNDHFARYLASDLGAAAFGPYSQDNPAAAGGLNGWNWGPNTSPFGDWPYGSAITELMAANPRFRLFVGNGWTDTQTTVGAMNYLVSQSGWPQDRVRAVTYRGGHMPYSIETSLKAFTDDVRAMVTGAW